MGVIMQAFYWNCPRLENQEFQWWNYIRTKIPSLQKTGFTAIWLPPANKAANLDGMSMGYDPYDYYDLGDFDQKGSVKTWFGSKEELIILIKTIHDSGMYVYADIVLNHNNGADEEEINPIDKQKRWTKFNPKSTRFLRDWACFHPSFYESMDNMTFGSMPDLCHRNPDVYTELLEYARWLIETINFDGFRYDCVKGYGGWMVRAIQELRGIKNETAYKPFGVGECWDSDRTIIDWLDETNAWSDNPACAFDFPLRSRLRDMCQSYGYSLKNLMDSGAVYTDRPMQAVTFVENHDVERDDPIITDKMMAYAFILTHEGYPCVFWRDYYNYGLAKENNPSGIAALVGIHEQFAAGSTSVLYADDDLYIMQRSGWAGQKGLIFILNNRSSWNGTSVQTQWKNAKFTVLAYGGKDNSVPGDKWTNGNGYTDFWAPPRGYAVYVPS